MGSEFTQTTVSDLIAEGLLEKPLDGNHGGIHPKSSDYVSRGIPFIMASDLLNGRVDTIGCKFITPEQAAKLRKGFAREEKDVLLSHKATIGRTAIVGPISTEYVVLTPQVTYYRVKDQNKLNNKYLKYYFDSKDFQGILNQWAGGGSTRAYLGITGQLKLPVVLPDITTQERIAHFVGALDDKIELNRQMNATLEAMAQTLFKSWFVDFDPVIDNAMAAGNPIPDELAARAERRAKAAQQHSPEHPHTLPAAIRQQFPDRFVFTETMGWVPEGWDVLSLSSAIQINPKVTLRKGHIAKYVDMKALPTSGYGIDEFVWKPYAGGAKFTNDDLLLARITPCLENGKTGLVDFFLEDNEPGFGSTEFIVMRGKGALSTAYVACLARDTNFRLHCVASMVGSSGRQRVQNACFDSYFVCVPEDEGVLKLFNIQCSPFFTKMTALKNETFSLPALRDTLLPKLLSGQLRIPEAEQLLAEAL